MHYKKKPTENARRTLMDIKSRQTLNNAFNAFSILTVAIMVITLFVLLGPIIWRGIDAYIFNATIEHRKIELELFNRGKAITLQAEIDEVENYRQPLYIIMNSFEHELEQIIKSNPARGFKLEADYELFKNDILKLLGPRKNERQAVMMRDRYGQTRWDGAMKILHELQYIESWDYSRNEAVKTYSPREKLYHGTKLETAFKKYINEEYLTKMLMPSWTFYYGFLTDKSYDAHLYGGVWAEVLGTIYLTFGAMFLAIPIGVISAVYLVEYARDTKVVSFIRSCIGTLAGVPSVVFGLFGLACFISDESFLQISNSPSVAAGCATLALLILPTIIRASEEAIRAVPHTYKEGAVGLGASKWQTVSKVILPASLPGILTGIVISMGRAAGETAPIIFTAAVSVGKPLSLSEIFTQPTPALPWNIYNLCTEHEAVDEIRHVQYGMIFTLVAIVLILNLSAIFMRAKISKKLKG